MKKTPEQMKKELWTMGMIALALFFIALARGMSGDFDVKFTIASTGSVVCASLCFFYSIRYNKTIKKKIRSNNMKAYITKHIITTIIVLVISGGIFGFCYGWPYGLAVGGTFLSYALTVFFRNSTYPALFGWQEDLDTKTVWKMMGCTMLFVLGVMLVSAAMSEGTDAIPRAIMLTCGYVLSLLGGYLTRKVWLNNMSE